jgi:hypothetical protein
LTGKAFDDCVIQGSNIATNLYPHQKKALTFLLEREQESDSGTSRVLWTPQKDATGRIRGWQNRITGKDTQKEPTPDKGGILADDVSFTFLALAL